MMGRAAGQNMEQAIRYGDRLIMMHEGRTILDVSGEEKSRLTIPEVVERMKHP